MDVLRKKRAFVSGCEPINPQVVQDDQSAVGKKKPSPPSFVGVPDVLPVELSDSQLLLNSSARAGGDSRLIREEASPGNPWQAFYAEEGSDADLVSRLKLIDYRRVPMEKPVAIIYNPNSGRKENLVP